MLDPDYVVRSKTENPPPARSSILSDQWIFKLYNMYDNSVGEK